MVSMKTTKCPKCGGIVFKLTGKASKLCYDECLDCRKKREAETDEFEQGNSAYAASFAKFPS